MAEVRTAAVVGAGTMGHGIAQVFAQAGHAVSLVDSRPEALTEASERIRGNLALLLDQGVITPEKADATWRRIRMVDSLQECLKNAEFITECVTEDLDLKRQVFEQLDCLAPSEAIIASNTSSLSLADISLKVKHKSRLIITHYFNPPYLIPTVEVAVCDFTATATVERTCATLREIDKQPILLKKNLPGFLVNRVQAAIIRELLHLWEEGVATVEQIDNAVTGTIGLRLAVMGPFKIMDFGGLDVWTNVARNLFPHLDNSKGVPSALAERYEAGHWGFKSGRGFYDWIPQGRASAGPNETYKRDRTLIRLLQLGWKP
jgi:3-hydroxybutyryl-CoA dehydrogenase